MKKRMKPLKHKSFAYITHQGRLLVFRHVHYPEAGMQVPAGAIKPGEAPDHAALREAWEETGLAGLSLVGYLGEQTYDMTPHSKDERHHRRFYHLRCTETPPEIWQHAEPDMSGGDGERPLFAFFWATLPDGVPPLIAGHDAFLPILIERLALEGPYSC